VLNGRVDRATVSESTEMSMEPLGKLLVDFQQALVLLLSVRDVVRRSRPVMACDPNQAIEWPIQHHAVYDFLDWGQHLALLGNGFGIDFCTTFQARVGTVEAHNTASERTSIPV
jgi:hypothetical protein